MSTGPNSRLRYVMTASFFAALAGAFLASYFGPKVIAWYFDPPVNIGINCRSAVEWSMSRLQSVQAWGMAGGLVLGIALGLWLTRMPSDKKRPESKH